MPENPYEPPKGEPEKPSWVSLGVWDELPIRDRQSIADREHLESELERYDAPLRELPDSDTTPEEDNFINAYVYWSVVISNDTLFETTPTALFEMREVLEAIGATRTVAAAEELLPLYQQYEQSGDGALFKNTHADEIARVTARAESMKEYAELLLKYAKQNLPERLP